jgi:hypothetical protein
MATANIVHERDLRDFPTAVRDNPRAAGFVSENGEINPSSPISWVAVAILRRSLCI